MKLFIVANRLPVKAVEADGKYTFVRSEGGLATGLSSLQSAFETHWIGWPGLCPEKDDEKKDIAADLRKMKLHPVFFSKDQYRDYYEGYCNSTIWPLCHYFFSFTQVKKSFFDCYRAVNQLFCNEVARIARPGDRVWVQDYQLMLLPGMLRQACPGVHIAYFHHIPFPSYELFRILPERAELLRGLLGADFIAFHCYDYMRHFLSAVERVLHLNFTLNGFHADGHVVKVDALPMGINYNLYHQAAQTPAVEQQIEKKRKQIGSCRLLLSVDRLDYSKGILHRLQGYKIFLEQHPEYRENVVLMMVIAPSRDNVESYTDLKVKIDEAIGKINGLYSTVDWTPVVYFYHGFPFEELAAMYYLADVALVTPLRDGMNLVAKEFVATKNGNSGVLVLSEMAGAAAELTEAVLINPNDTDQIARAIDTALAMPLDEQLRRIAKMQKVVSVQTVDKWAAKCMAEWDDAVALDLCFRKKIINPNLQSQMLGLFSKAGKRLFILDYDGTLAAFRNRPEEAAPTADLKDLLSALGSLPGTRVVISSGRSWLTLDQWFGSLPVCLAAEHGAYYKENGKWHRNVPKAEWSESLLSTLRAFMNNTPRSWLEIKDTGLAWHYRATDPWLGEFRARQLVHSLYSVCMLKNLRIIPGNKVVEIKLSQCSKGSEALRLLHADNYDFVMAVGDDTTDEDMFRVLPPEALTIKVGQVSEMARYNLQRQEDVLPFLAAFAENGRDVSQVSTGWKGWMARIMGKITNKE